MTNILLLPALTGTGIITLNADWEWTIPFKTALGVAIDLTGIAFRLQVRANEGDVTCFLEAATSDWSGSVGAGRLVNGGAGASLTSAIKQPHYASLSPGQAVMDVLASADGQLVNLCENGPIKLTVRKGVTR